MISLDKARLIATPPTKLTELSCQRLIANILLNPQTHKVNTHYNDPTVRKALESYHHNKCVYCETDVSAGASFRVDHYRPKRYIKDVDPLKHYGYYWLAYEWTNLLQSCEACNRAKSNQFPLWDESTRVPHLTKPPDYTIAQYRPIKTDPLMLEKRLLLHPELDEIEEYFIFNADGLMLPVKAINKSEEQLIREKIAKETIRICDLNRGNLIRKRKKKIDSYFSDLVDILNDYEDRGADSSALKFLHSDLRRYFKKMLREQDEKEEYSRVGFYMFHNFKNFYIDKLSEKGYLATEPVADFYADLIRPKALSNVPY